MNRDVPNWVVAIIASVTMLAGGVGVYTALASKVDVFASEMLRVKDDVRDLESNDNNLQEQVVDLRTRVTVLESLVKAKDKGVEVALQDVKKSVDSLAKSLENKQ